MEFPLKSVDLGNFGRKSEGFSKSSELASKQFSENPRTLTFKPTITTFSIFQPRFSPGALNRTMYEEIFLIFLYFWAALSWPTLLQCFLKGVSKNTYEIHIKISKNVLFWTVFKANFSFRQF